MKKLIALALACILALSFSACGNRVREEETAPEEAETPHERIVVGKTREELSSEGKALSEVDSERVYAAIARAEAENGWLEGFTDCDPNGRMLVWYESGLAIYDYCNCGTINDTEIKRHLILSEDDRSAVNEILDANITDFYYVSPEIQKLEGTVHKITQDGILYVTETTTGEDYILDNWELILSGTWIAPGTSLAVVYYDEVTEEKPPRLSKPVMIYRTEQGISNRSSVSGWWNDWDFGIIFEGISYRYTDVEAPMGAYPTDGEGLLFLNLQVRRADRTWTRVTRIAWMDEKLAVYLEDEGWRLFEPITNTIDPSWIEPMDYVPDLLVQSGGQTITVAPNFTSWEYYGEGDGELSFEIQGFNPLDPGLGEELPALLFSTDSTETDAKSGQGFLVFDSTPDWIAVYCWDESYQGQLEEYDQLLEDVPCEGPDYGFTLKDGGCIYEVDARWYGNPDEKTVTYVFYAAPA